MSTWKSESDVLLDLETLSGFSNVSRISHPTSKAFGGSRSLPVANQPEKNDYSNCVSPDSKYDRIPSGRGQMIQQLSEFKSRNRPGDLHSQLRKACGRGYSNELIEAEFGLYSKYDFPSAEQPKNCEDCDERLTSPTFTHSPSSEEKLSMLVGSSGGQSMPTKPNKLFAHPRKVLKKRNVLLNSLSNLHHMQPINNATTVQQAEDDSSVYGECSSETRSNTSTTLSSCSQKNDVILPYTSECSFINSGKSANAIIHQNHCVNIISSDTLRPKMKHNLTISDYCTIDGIANSESSQFMDNTCTDSRVLLDSQCNRRGGFNMTSEDFPPL